jgi:hypothetical protein
MNVMLLLSSEFMSLPRMRLVGAPSISWAAHHCGAPNVRTASEVTWMWIHEHMKLQQGHALHPVLLHDARGWLYAATLCRSSSARASALSWRPQQCATSLERRASCSLAARMQRMMTMVKVNQVRICRPCCCCAAAGMQVLHCALLLQLTNMQ